jgi:hypothetical protein
MCKRKEPSKRVKGREVKVKIKRQWMNKRRGKIEAIYYNKDI